jgi:hypothetical protein
VRWRDQKFCGMACYQGWRVKGEGDGVSDAKQ